MPESAFTPFTPAFDSIVETQLKKWHLPGASISVVHNESTWSKGYGVADVDSNMPVDPARTIFYGASTTKAQLAACWALYIASEANKSKPADQKISWTTPLAKIIPDDFVLSDPVRTSQITLEDCLSHRTGLSRHETVYGWGDIKTTKAITRSLRHLPFTTEIRTKMEYCNTPFIAASHALETVTGKPFSQILRESLWQPLGMDHTYDGHGEAEYGGDNVVTPYTWSKSPADPEHDKGILIQEERINVAPVSGAGYVMTTADDYAKWMRALLQPSTGPLSKEILKELWKPRISMPRDEDSVNVLDGIVHYGLGWFVSTYKSHMVYYHGGGLTGAGCLITVVPSLNFGVSYFANGADPASKLQGLTYELIDVVLGVSGPETIKKAEQSFLKGYKTLIDDYSSSRSRLYPTAPPATNVPLALPLAKYAGTYRNAVFGPITLNPYHGSGGHGSADQLICYMYDRTWRRIQILSHVNAEHWLVTEYSGATSKFDETGDGPYKTAYKAQTRVGVDGEVEAIGLAIETALPDYIVWYERQSRS
ncbi:beta-lactamase/transpeptidase-like protein [Thozetella sp. PMI_491]|nr:beta-lactamase/transpeptidase-like protein [Thozetella sp. PMI_491]